MTKEIAKNIHQVSTGIQNVTGNVNQSASVTAEISKDIADVNQAAGHMAEMSNTVDRKSAEFADLAANLNNLVKQFKV